MTINEALSKYNFISKVLLKNENDALSKELKVKIMAMRIELSKVRKQFDADIQEFVKDLAPDEFKKLQQIPEENRTEEQKTRLKELTDQINSEYNLYIQNKSSEEVNVKDYSFNEDEFNEILAVNVDNNVEINGVKLEAADFLEIFNTLFVK